MDLRRATRYLLDAAVLFSWGDERNVLHEGEGRTRDISERGVFVLARQCPPEGSTVLMNILLPAFPGARRILKIRAIAKVVRAESRELSEACDGFAVLNKRVVLQGLETTEEVEPERNGNSSVGRREP